MSASSIVIGARELSERLAGTGPPVLLDVRLDSDHARSRIPGAVSNCVFEVAFLERMPAVAPDRSRPVCVYGADEGSLESRVAAEKLCRAGWSEVLDFREGLSGWRAAGFPVDDITPPPVQPPIRSGVHAVDLKESRVLWTGRNLLNRHDGAIPLRAGKLIVESGRLVGGEFSFDMKGITCSDLEGDSLHDVLIAHLLSDDFFDVEVFPEAGFVITRTSPINGASAGAPNLGVSGELTLKGITKPVEFAACTGITEEGKLAAQASFAIDRTKWNVVYGSGKFFRHLGGHLVNDLIDLNLRIVSV